MGVAVVAQQAQAAFTQAGKGGDVARSVDPRVQGTNAFGQIGREIVDPLNHCRCNEARCPFIDHNAEPDRLAILGQRHLVGPDNSLIKSTIGIERTQTLQVAFKDVLVEATPSRPGETSPLLGFDDRTQLRMCKGLCAVDVQCRDAYGVFVQARCCDQATRQHCTAQTVPDIHRSPKCRDRAKKTCPKDVLKREEPR